MASPRGLRLFLSLSCAFLLSGFVLAGQEPARPLTSQAELAAKLPTDPEVLVGTFPNGLKYYIRKNLVPQNRAELRLVVNAGSLLEEDDQQGLAHFVEHMAFNGTKNFPKSDLVKFMESIGMRFGPSVNAFTSFDETVYMLQIPTDKPEVIDRSFLILEDWARNVTFDPAEVDKERGVIMEEWRLRRGAAARMQDQQLPVLLKGSKYADRLPIGKTDILQNFKHDRLKQFYADWYRPDLMGVIAVGDFDKAAIEALIKKHFAGIPAAAKPKPRPTFDLPKQPGTLYSVATDPEAAQTTVSVYSKMAFRDPTSVGAYRQMVVERLFGSMFSARLNDLAQKPDSPFLGAAASRGLFVKSAEASTISALSKDDQVAKTLQVLFAETERLVKFGFTAGELDREKASYQRSIDQMLTEEQKRQSGQLADEYVRNFTQAEPFPGLANEANITRRVMPTITLAEMNSLAKEWMPEGNRVVMISAPKKAGITMPDEAQLAAAIKAGASQPLTAYTETATATTLLAREPKAGTVVKSSTKADIVVEWELSNGAKVVLKPTTFKEDEVVFRAFSPGGTSLVADADVVWAESSSTLVGNSGLGSFNRTELRKMLNDKIAVVGPYIEDLSEGINGSASAKDLETLFQLIYMTFVEPRADPDFFNVMKTQTKVMLGNMQANPMFAFQEAIGKALTQDHPRSRTPTPEMLDTMDLNKSLAFYKDRFSDASDFTFVFVGRLDPATVRPLVEKYIASLPSTGRKETWKDHNVTTPDKVVTARVDKGLEPQGHTRIVFSGPFTYNQEQRIAIRAVATVLETRLREILREELGGTYSVSVAANYDKYPKQDYSLAIDFGSNPDRTEELVKRVFTEIDAFLKSGPTDKQVADAKEAFIRDYENNMTNNGYLLQQISTKYEYGETDELPVLFDLANWYKKLSPASVQAAARQYLNTKRYVLVSLYPEKR